MVYFLFKNLLLDIFLLVFYENFVYDKGSYTVHVGLGQF